MISMPFNFDRLNNGKVFISNFAGFHSFVDKEELNLLADNNSPSEQFTLKWFTEFGHLNRGDMLTSEQHRCSNEKKKF
ncbi:hypothetical protein CPI84_05695 [Erwinia pyrifoliae]|nr:hypothetical protein CPI84_05695 [Erwinia pyrifoliae]